MQQAERLDLGQVVYSKKKKSWTETVDQYAAIRAAHTGVLNMCVCLLIFKSCLAPHRSFKSSKNNSGLLTANTHPSIPTAVSLQRLIIEINSIKACNCCSETQMLSQTELK